MQIPKVFDGDPISVITSIEISPKGTNTNISPKTLGMVHKFDLSLLHPLSFNGNKKVTLKFDTQQEINEYAELLAEIKKGWFTYHMKNILNSLNVGVIDGYGDAVYLQNVFNGVKGTKKAPKEAKKSLEWMERFYRVFILNIVTANKKGGHYVNSPTLQSKIVKQMAFRIKQFLPQKESPPSPQNTVNKGGSTKQAIIKEAISSYIFRKMLG